MPAFRGKNLRSGDLAEQLGILLLQSVALVAPIPRTEDVGIDVVATLIRSFDSYKFIAEDSFFVQIKSSSVSEITFENGEPEWLFNLQLPFFIASVDRKTSTIKLYNTHNLSDVLVMNPNRKKITLQLLEDDKNFDNSDINESISIPIGPAIIQWSLDTIENDKMFIEHFYKLLKKHLLLAKKSIDTRKVGVVEMATWETDKEPTIYGKKIKPVGTFDEMGDITSPYFQALLHRLTLGEDMFTTRSLYLLLEKILTLHGHFEVVDGKRVLIKYTAPLNTNDNEQVNSL